MNDVTEIFWFLLKVMVISLPFYALGWLVSPIAPDLGFGLTCFLMVSVTGFGFFAMVMSNNSNEDSQKIQDVALKLKIAFIVLFIFTIACIIRLDSLDAKFVRFFSIPMFLIAAKIILKLNLTDYLNLD